MALNYNPHYRLWNPSQPSARGGAGSYETYGPELQNIVWQTRPAAPTDYELRLGEAMETAFGEGIVELAPLIARLHQLGVYSPSGQAWTEQSFQAEMKRLGF